MMFNLNRHWWQAKNYYETTFSCSCWYKEDLLSEFPRDVPVSELWLHGSLQDPRPFYLLKTAQNYYYHAKEHSKLLSGFEMIGINDSSYRNSNDATIASFMKPNFLMVITHQSFMPRMKIQSV